MVAQTRGRRCARAGRREGTCSAGECTTWPLSAQPLTCPSQMAAGARSRGSGAALPPCRRRGLYQLQKHPAGLSVPCMCPASDPHGQHHSLGHGPRCCARSPGWQCHPWRRACACAGQMLAGQPLCRGKRLGWRQYGKRPAACYRSGLGPPPPRSALAVCPLHQRAAPPQLGHEAWRQLQRLPASRVRRAVFLTASQGNRAEQPLVWFADGLHGTCMPAMHSRKHPGVRECACARASQ